MYVPYLEILFLKCLPRNSVVCEDAITSSLLEQSGVLNIRCQRNDMVTSTVSVVQKTATTKSGIATTGLATSTSILDETYVAAVTASI